MKEFGAKPFYIQMEKVPFDKGDILFTDIDKWVKVINVYNTTWWRRLLKSFGLNIRIHQIKVVQVKPSI